MGHGPIQVRALGCKWEAERDHYSLQRASLSDLVVVSSQTSLQAWSESMWIFSCRDWNFFEDLSSLEWTSRRGNRKKNRICKIQNTQTLQEQSRLPVAVAGCGYPRPIALHLLFLVSGGVRAPVSRKRWQLWCCGKLATCFLPLSSARFLTRPPSRRARNVPLLVRET